MTIFIKFDQLYGDFSPLHRIIRSHIIHPPMRPSPTSHPRHHIACGNVDVVVGNYIAFVEYNMALNSDGAFL